MGRPMTLSKALQARRLPVWPVRQGVGVALLRGKSIKLVVGRYRVAKTRFDAPHVSPQMKCTNLDQVFWPPLALPVPTVAPLPRGPLLTFQLLSPSSSSTSFPFLPILFSFHDSSQPRRTILGSLIQSLLSRGASPRGCPIQAFVALKRASVGEERLLTMAPARGHSRPRRGRRPPRPMRNGNVPG